MTRDLYRFEFIPQVPIEDVEAALLLAVWGCEALHGEAQTRLDAAHYFDPVSRVCVISADTPVGRDLNKLFIKFLSREIDEDAFRVDKALEFPEPAAAAA